MTARELVTAGTRTLMLAEVDTPYLDAVVLLAHAAGVTKERLLSALPEPVDGEAEARFLGYLDRRASGVPVSYIRRSKEFYGLEFYVDERVLVPRPDTETLVERVLFISRADPRVRDVRDVCTGSGCVGITLKREAPSLVVSASDISAEAEAVFRINCDRLLGQPLPFALTDLLDGVPERSLDLVAANPPYLRDGEVDGLVKIGWPEPPISLRGGREGTELAARLIRDSALKLRPGGWLVMEAAPDQFTKLHALLDQAGFRGVEVDRDLAGRERVISGQVPAAPGAAERTALHG
jgi:release factor glutamine methyltransferase